MEWHDRENVVQEKKFANKRLRVLEKMLRKFELAEEKDLFEEALNEVCKILVEEGRYAYAWVGLVEDGILIPIAKYGDHHIEIPQSVEDLVETVIRSREIMAVNNIGSEKGYVSLAVLPLVYRGKIIGVLNVYAPEKDFFDEDELRLLKLVARSLLLSITFTKKKEKGRKTHDFYRTIVEKAKVGIIVIEDRKIIFVNEEAEDLMGRRMIELLGKHFTDFVFPEDQDKITRLCEECIEDSSSSKTFEIRLLGRGGTPLWTVTTFFLVPAFKYIVASFIDVTKLKKVKKQVDENIEGFAALVDRIRNPLTILSAYAEMYVKDQEVLEKMRKQINEIIELIKQLEKGWTKSEAIRDYLMRERKNRMKKG